MSEQTRQTILVVATAVMCILSLLLSMKSIDSGRPRIGVLLAAITGACLMYLYQRFS